MFVCLFEFFVPLENFSLIWRRHHCRWRTANFDLYSALVAIEQWVFFSVSHALWHGTSFYNGHLRGLMALTLFGKRLAVELSLPNLTTYVCRGLDSNTQTFACGPNTLTHHATAAVPKSIKGKHATMNRTFLKNIKHTFAINNQDCWVHYS